MQESPQKHACFLINLVARGIVILKVRT